MPTLAKVRSIQVGGETTFGTAASNYTTMRVEADSDIQLEQSAIVNEIAKSGDYEIARILGGKRGTAVTKMKLHGWTSAAVSSAPSRTEANDANATAFDQLLAILASACGNVYSGGYVAATIAATGTPVNALTATGGTELTTFESGQAVCWATGTTRRAYELGWITSNTAATPDSAGLLQTPRRTPQGSALWGSHNIFVRDGQPYTDGTVKSWTIKFLGHDAADAIIAYGCQPIGCKFSFVVNQVPTVEITWGIAHWARPGSGGAPAIPAWTMPEPQVALDWQMAIGDTSAVGYAVAKSVDLDVGLTRVALESGHSDSGVEGWYKTMTRPKATMQVHFANSWYTTFDGQTSIPVTFQHGTAPGRIFGFAMPAARLVNLPKRGDLEGVAVVDLEWEAHLYTGDAGSDATKPYDSPLKLAFA